MLGNVKSVCSPQTEQTQVTLSVVSWTLIQVGGTWSDWRVSQLGGARFDTLDEVGAVNLHRLLV